MACGHWKVATLWLSSAIRDYYDHRFKLFLGFSLGDELGFKESLSNVESNRRRSSQASRLQAQLIQAQQKMQTVGDFCS